METESCGVFNVSQFFLFKSQYFIDLFFFQLNQIVNWRRTLKFPHELTLSQEAKQLLCRFLCDVDHRIGTRSIDEIKVYNRVALD